MAKGVAEEYTSSLADLTVNSKPLINMLTMLAEDYIEHAPTIVRTVEAHLQKVPGDIKLPVLYLIDSIVKNVGKDYVSLFTQNIVSTFCTVFEQVDEKIRSQMFKLRQTWNEVFPPKKLYALDARVNAIDPAWPITANPPHGRIHVNPKFLNPVPPAAFAAPESNQPVTDGAMREELLKQQKELLELQKRKVELELLQTKAILEEQQKKLENQTASFKTEVHPCNTEKPKIVQDVPDPFPVVKNKVFAEENHDNKKAFENTRVRDPRLRLKKNNSKRPNGPTFVIPERVKPSRANLFGDDDNFNCSEENRNIVNSDFNSVKRNEKNERRSDRRHKKYKEHKPRHKSSPDEYTPGVNRGANNIQEIIKPKENPQIVIDPVSLGYSNDKSSISGSNKESETKSDEPSKSKASRSSQSTSSPSKSRLRNKGKEKSKRRTESDVTNDAHAKDEALKSHPSESHSASSCNNETVAHTVTSVQSSDLRMEIEEKNTEEDKMKDSSSISPRKDLSITSTTDGVAPLPCISAHSKDSTPETICDTDLRLLPPSKTEAEQPPEKKTKAEIQKLFGEEDVDLRKFPPPTPPTPPPPVISNSLDLISDLETSKGWARIKRSSSDSTSPNKSSKKMKHSYSTSKVSFFNAVEDDPEEDSNILKYSEDEGRSQSYCLFMKQAEEQLKNGTITFTQYSQILKGVMSMNEESKLQKAILKDEMESLPSGDISGSSGISESSPNEKDQHYISHDFDNEMKFASTAQDIKSDSIEDQLEMDKNSGEAVSAAFSDQGNEHSLRKRALFKDQFHRGKEQRPRYFTPEPFFIGNNKNWMMRPPPPNFVHRPARKEMMFNRWPFQNFSRVSFDSKQMNFAQPTRGRSMRHHVDISLPPADPNVLEMIKNDVMSHIPVQGVSREIRFYGENAIVMADWDDPRDLMFQPGSRRVFIDGVDILTLQFNSQYREITLTDGIRIRIRLGAPTRELFIDGRYYDVKFGGPPVEINLGGRTHLIQLEGPMPFIKIGSTKRTDLVAGKVHLIVDGNIENLFPVYLDAKPQRFEIGNVPFIIRFVEALQTVVINGQPFKIQFGGLPVPIFFRGEKHFLRLTSLPPGITPGYVNILNMEGGRLPTPPPPITPPPPQINGFEPPTASGFIKQSVPAEMQSGLVGPMAPAPFFGADYHLFNNMPGLEQPVDVLTSLMTPPTLPNFSQVPSQNYIIDPAQETTSAPASTSPTAPNINVSELYKQLVAIGVVPPLKDKDSSENRLAVKPVDFSKPETLKVRQQGLINRLYSGIQCSSCGVRFAPEQTVKHSQHLDWHFRQNRRERHSSKIALSRKWNYDLSDWIQYQEIEDIEDRAQSWFEMQEKKGDPNDIEEKDEPTVPAKGFGENPCCTVCRDKFDQFFNEEKEEWQLKMAICEDDKLYHPLCYKDEQENCGKNVGEMLMNIQEELRSIETIVIDDSIVDNCGDNERSDDVKEESQNNTSETAENNSLSHSHINTSGVADEDSSVPLKQFEGDPVCIVCLEKIEEFLDEETNEQLLKPAIFVNGQIFHPKCYNKKEENNLNPPQEESTKPDESIETIILEDSVANSNDDNGEEIELETVNMSIEETEQETSKISEENNITIRHEDSDDDILEINVLKPNIESYEILDDEEEVVNDQISGDENSDSDIKVISNEIDASESGGEETESNIVIKTEKVDIVNLSIGNPSHVTETISLDGNSEFSAPKMVLPKKIKINISSITQKNAIEETTVVEQEEDDGKNEESAIAFSDIEPLPPGEELYPAHLKPNLFGRRLVEVPAKRKGQELSGLCSIM